MARIESFHRRPRGRDLGPLRDAPTPPSEVWSELVPDVFTLPAAVEAAQARADEGPGPWPPVVADDPADAPSGPPRAAAVPATPPLRRPIDALKRFLRQIK